MLCPEMRISHVDVSRYHPSLNSIHHRIDFRSDRIARRLHQLGLRERKSVEGFRAYAPVKYVRHYVRGFIDGDGTIGTPKHPVVSIHCSCRSALTAITKMISRGARVSVKPPREIRKDFWRISWAGYDDLCRIYHWLYDGARHFLMRKKLRLQKLTVGVQ